MQISDQMRRMWELAKKVAARREAAKQKQLTQPSTSKPPTPRS